MWYDNMLNPVVQTGICVNMLDDYGDCPVHQVTGNTRWWYRGSTGKQMNTGKTCNHYREYVCSVLLGTSGILPAYL